MGRGGRDALPDGGHGEHHTWGSSRIANWSGPGRDILEALEREADEAVVQPAPNPTSYLASGLSCRLNQDSRAELDPSKRREHSHDQNECDQ